MLQSLSRLFELEKDPEFRSVEFFFSKSLYKYLRNSPEFLEELVGSGDHYKISKSGGDLLLEIAFETTKDDAKAVFYQYDLTGSVKIVYDEIQGDNSVRVWAKFALVDAEFGKRVYGSMHKSGKVYTATHVHKYGHSSNCFCHT